MAATSFLGQSTNPLSLARTGGTYPTANEIINVSSWADALEPQLTPIQSRVKKGEAVDNPTLRWGQSYRTAVSGNTAAALDTTETDVTFASSEGKLLQRYMVLEIIDYVAGTTRLDYTTREEVIVNETPDGTDARSTSR